MVSRQLLNSMLKDLESLRVECQDGLGSKGFIAPWCMRDKLARIEQTLSIIEGHMEPGEGTVGVERD